MLNRGVTRHPNDLLICLGVLRDVTVLPYILPPSVRCKRWLVSTDAASTKATAAGASRVMGSLTRRCVPAAPRVNSTAPVAYTLCHGTHQGPHVDEVQLLGARREPSQGKLR